MSVAAGYSGTPLPRKLGIREGDTVLVTGLAVDFQFEFESLPAGVKVHRRGYRPHYDLVLALCPEHATLLTGFPRWKAFIWPAGSLWVGWPKRSAGTATDLTEGAVRAEGLAAGLVDIKVCAVDDVWSALRFVYRRSDRPTASRTHA